MASIISCLRKGFTIRDFNFAEGDRIDLSQIDANGDARDGDQAFAWGGNTGSPGPGQLSYQNLTGPDGPYIQLWGNTADNAIATELSLRLQPGGVTPTPDWFIL